MQRAQAAAEVLAVQWHYASRGRSLSSTSIGRAALTVIVRTSDPRGGASARTV